MSLYLRKHLIHLVLPIIVLALSNSSMAATTTTTFTVTATVVATCSVSATDLSFGNYDPVSVSDLDATNTVTVTCTDGTSYDVGLDAGVGAGATVATRKLTNAGNTLDYTLYQDAPRTTVWGNTVGVDTINDTAGAVSTDHTVYGRIGNGQNVPAGLYSDTVTVTVTY
jgi:spore coat protein U-like protein